MNKITTRYFLRKPSLILQINIPKTLSFILPFLCVLFLSGQVFSHAPQRHTHVEIVGDMFYINEVPTYQGRVWTAPNGEQYKIEGLLMNSRMVQGIFDDLNPETRERWAYPDTGEWDPERNTLEFVQAMESWRNHGLLAFTLNLQGGSPEGYSWGKQPWHNSSFTADGSLRADYMKRLKKILDRADELGMVVILGYFYFGQDERLEDEEAVINAVDNATMWLLDKGYRNVIVEVNNECDILYDHAILECGRIHELIERIQGMGGDDHILYVGTSYSGGKIPADNVIEASDFILLHGNSVYDPNRLAEMVRIVRENKYYTPKPILVNEDDNYRFDEPWNNYIAAISEYASWGYFDWRRQVEQGYFEKILERTFGRFFEWQTSMEPFEEGFQSLPVDWSISSQRKKGFFNLTLNITGYCSDSCIEIKQPTNKFQEIHDQ